MSSRTTSRRNAWPRIGMLAVFCFAVALPCLHGQSEDRGLAPDEEPTPDALALQIRPDRDMTRFMKAVREYAEAKAWADVAKALSKALHPEKAGKFIERRPGEITTLEAEASRILASLPPEGREAYVLTLQPRAAELLEAAEKANDSEKILAVARQYPFTPASTKALQSLITREKKVERWVRASALYSRLMTERPLKKWSLSELHDATITAQHAGMTNVRAKVEAVLRTKLGDAGARIDGRFLTPQMLTKELEDITRAKQLGYSWKMFGGSPARTQKAIGSIPTLSPTWSEDLLDPSRRVEPRPLLDKQLESFTKLRNDNGSPHLTASFPVAVTVQKRGKDIPLVIYRSFWGTHAHRADTGKVYWRVSSEYTLSNLTRARTLAPTLQWLNLYRTRMKRGTVPFENSVIHTLSSDDEMLYLVEDVGVIPFQSVDSEPIRRGQPLGIPDEFTQNVLRGFNLVTGKLHWTVGRLDRKDDPLRGSIFLGPPLPIEGRLYVLAEKDKILRLHTLDREWGKLLGSLELGATHSEAYLDFFRRQSALPIAHAEGMLVCPTGCGTLVGVDLLTTTVRWSHTYRDAPKPAPPARPVPAQPFPRDKVRARDGREYPAKHPNLWGPFAPYIVGDRVVFTSYESDKIHCVELETGKLLWEQPRHEDDLFLAGVFEDQVLMVGKKECRSLDLKKCKTTWRLRVGEPSGRGVAVGGAYHLPLRKGIAGKPELCVIELKKGAIGKILAHVPVRKGPALGNLVYADNRIISQSSLHIAVYPESKELLQKIGALLKKNPKDPVAHLFRACYHQAQGKIPEAVADAHFAYTSKTIDPDSRKDAKILFYETTTHLLRSNFESARKYLTDYEKALELSLEEADGDVKRRTTETAQRRSVYHQLAAQASLERGESSKALDHVLAVVEHSAKAGDSLLPSPTDPALKVTPLAWAQSFLATLMKKAKPEEKKKIEAEIERLLEKFLSDPG